MRTAVTHRAPGAVDAPATISLSAHVARPGTRDRLVETARDYARGDSSENALRAYRADWKHFARWRRLKGTGSRPPDSRGLPDGERALRQIPTFNMSP